MAAGEGNRIELSKHYADEISGSYILEDTIPEAIKGSGAEEIFPRDNGQAFPKLKKDKSQTEILGTLKNQSHIHTFRYFDTS